jgi:hypothetical protein
MKIGDQIFSKGITQNDTFRGSNKGYLGDIQRYLWYLPNIGNFHYIFFLEQIFSSPCFCIDCSVLFQ